METGFKSTPVLIHNYYGPATSDQPTAELFSALMKKLCDQAGPSGLMTGTDAAAVVAVKVFKEQ
jgi:hypothetical protein